MTKYEDSLEQVRDYAGTYSMAPLARTRHQPDLKTFSVEVIDLRARKVSLTLALTLGQG